MITLKESNKLNDEEQNMFKRAIFEINGIQENQLSTDQFVQNNIKWETQHNAIFFAIFENTTITGSISLSKMDHKAHSASCGYQILEKYRNRKIASKAFLLIIEQARSRGIKILQGKIESGNCISKRIWEKYNATFLAIDNNKFLSSIEL